MGEMRAMKVQGRYEADETIGKIYSLVDLTLCEF